MVIIGIDLGTTNSLAAIWRDGRPQLIPNSLGEYLTPSVVSLDDDGTVLVGRAAQERLVSHPQRTASCFKREIGTDKTYTLGGRTFKPEELSALVLRQLREDAEAWLGEPVTEAVVSVPAYFAQAQRAATKRAGALAGLLVERLVNEPSAAAVSARIGEGGVDKLCLVFDFGGGTLDVSLVERFENVVSVTAVSGDNRLGGRDFELAIARGFFRGHDLIILDEPTAAIDPYEETLIYNRFAEIAREKSAVIVTHRLGSVKLADRILVMKDGEAVQIGTHDELIAREGEYKRLYEAQEQWYKS